MPHPCILIDAKAMRHTTFNFNVSTPHSKEIILYTSYEKQNAHPRMSK